jgi:hypothetical protein
VFLNPDQGGDATLDAGGLVRLGPALSALSPQQAAVFPSLAVRSCLIQSVYNVVLPKSIPAQICQLVLHACKNQGHIGRFVGELTSAKRLDTKFL